MNCKDDEEREEKVQFIKERYAELNAAPVMDGPHVYVNPSMLYEYRHQIKCQLRDNNPEYCEIADRSAELEVE